tara:strand:+ start:6326 stop:7222 length:897 start_codon:yes stop_codon:yes gene_type:complete
MYNHKSLIKQYDKKALVTELHGNRGKLWNSDSGFLPFLKKKQDNVVIGDFVEYESLDEKSVLINKIKPPVNQVERLNKKGLKKNLVNNVSQILLVIAPEPRPNYLLVDKFILISELIKCKLVIVLNKSDIRKDLIIKRLSEYSKIGYELIDISAKFEVNIFKFMNMLNNHSSLLVGQSGVGKSTITNLLLRSDNIKTRPLSEKSKTGKHTTTTTKIHLLNNDSFLIDTPGIENLHPNITNINDIKKGFIEINDHDLKCKYRDCSHLNEPSCVIKDLVEKDKISEQRYINYKKLISSYL